ncbi:MAG: WecB/TagA/CpsF family glycosyltransferase [Cyanobacteria bacterium REEB67]|nr:WecB/TagA/CpsF family glycosyltransferase [Cyanobacteria bacterium REEB67]
MSESNQLSVQNKNRESVLGYPVDLYNEAQALAEIETAWKNNRGLHVVTINAEMIVASQKDKSLDKIVRQADLIVPDGAGVVQALRLSGARVSRLPGIELADATLARAAALGEAVAFLGGRPEVMDKLLQVLPEKYPTLKIVAHQNGFFPAEDEGSVVEKISAAQPKLLLVALGVPRQEFFIARHAAKFKHTVVIGVGGSFDVWTGFVERAPEAYRNLNLEWFYRLKKEPWRFQRMAGSLPNFALQVLLSTAAKKLGLTKKK